MITKIQMQGVASYKSLVTLETDKKVNVVYGLNGSGKSTLSNFLYNPSSFDFLSCSLEKEQGESILVYNQKFINDHFYETDDLKGIFSLSKENKDIEDKIKVSEAQLKVLDEEIKAEVDLISAEESTFTAKKDRVYETVFEIKRKYTGGDRVLEFCLENLKRKDPLFIHISKLPLPLNKPEKDITSIKTEVEALNGENAQKYDLLPKLSFNELLIEKNEIFAQIIVGSSDSPVSKLITELNNSDWVKKGLNYITSKDDETPDTCPFCQSQTLTAKLVNDIENYFDESYEESIEIVTRFLERYADSVKGLLPLETYKANPFVSSYLSELTENYNNLDKNLNDNIQKIREKIQAPSKQFILTETENFVQVLNLTIENINKEISGHNARLNNIDIELKSLKSEFWSLMRWEYDQSLSPFFIEVTNSNNKINEANNRKDKAFGKAQNLKLEMVELQKSTVNVGEAVVNIKNGLLQLGITDFSIKEHSEGTYRVVRSEDCDAEFTSLSEGEKMIISFLYFCELCKGKRTATELPLKKIAVIDDPVSSLSHIFVYNIGQLIKSIFFKSDTFEQVIVLTHSLYFFYELVDSNHSRRKENQKLFRLSKNDNGTDIKTMKYEEVQNDYHSYWAVINDPNQPPALIANCMRNIIEYFFNFVQKADLSNVVQKPELQENKFQAFCRYISRESHSLGQNIFDFKEFNYEDFKEGLKLVFKVTGYPEHYNKMSTI